MVADGRLVVECAAAVSAAGSGRESIAGAGDGTGVAGDESGVTAGGWVGVEAGDKLLRCCRWLDGGG